MDVKSGEVPRSAAHRRSTRTSSRGRSAPRDYRRLSSAENGAPLSNRAIQGLYPNAGSTFKLITAVAALRGRPDHT